MKILSFTKAAKRKNFHTLFIALLVILAAGYSSCRKYIDYVNGGYDRPNGDCLVTHSEDDYNGFFQNVIYNKKGQPISTDPDFDFTINYDKKGRLIRSTYMPTGAHLDFTYKDNTFLPVELRFYHPWLGGLRAIDSFFYDKAGRMIKRGNININNPQYNWAEYYEYDQNHNVVNVMARAEYGGTYWGTELFSCYSVSKYDHKQNYLGGNQWLKYIFLYSGLYESEFLLLSANNAVNWKWVESTDGKKFHKIKARFEYNSKGFPNTITQNYYSPDGSFEYTVNRVSTSTCDVISPVKQGSKTFSRNARPMDFKSLRSFLPQVNEK